MSTGNKQLLRCEAFADRLEFYVSGELPPDQAQAVEGHVAGCAACEEELAHIRQLRAALKQAVSRSEVPPRLAGRIAAVIRREDTPPWYRRPWIMVAASTAVASLVAGFFLMGALGPGKLRQLARQDSYIERVTAAIATVLGVGLGDHIHCTVAREYPQDFPGEDRLQPHQKIEPEWRGIIETVKARVPEGFDLVMAHRCRYQDRAFTHLALKRDKTLLSVILTPREQGEAFARTGLLPAIHRDGLPVYQQAGAKWQVAGFETPGHFVYVVSDLSARENLSIMASLAPELDSFVRAREG